VPAIRLLARVPAVVRRDYVATAGTFWLTIASGLLLFHLVAQRSGVAGFTYYQVARGAVATVQPLAMAGLAPALHRYLPRAGRRIRVLARQVFLLEVVVLNVLGLITLLFAEDVGRLFGIGGAAQVRAVVLLTAGSSLCALAVAALRGCGDVRVSNLASLIGFGVVPLAAFAVTSEIELFLALQGAALAAVAVWGIVQAGPGGAEKAPASPRPAPSLRTLARYGIRRVPGDIALPGLFAFPTFFVAGAASNSADAGYVGFTTSTITLVCSIFGMLTPVLLPRLSGHAHAAAAADRELDASLAHGLRVLPFVAAGVAALASAVVVVTAVPVVHWFLGTDFHDAVAVVRFGVPVSIPLAVFYAARPTIDALREAPVTMWLLVGALVAEVVATYLAALVVPAWPASLAGFAAAAVLLAVFSYTAMLRAIPQAARKPSP
jgi:O-antigen/teichoic acid export membrane protein